MAATKTLAAAVRSGTGKGAARSVRREGRVPAVIYGGGDAAEPISLDHRETHKQIYAGHFLTTIFEIDIEGRKERVIPRDYQLDRVKDTPVHVDFLRLRPGSKLRLEIPVHLVNLDQAPGIKRGGTLNIVRHTVEMLVPADAIPESIIGNLAGLDINGSLHISACEIPEGSVPVQRDRDFTVATIVAPSGLAESQRRRCRRRPGRRRQGRRRCQGRQGHEGRTRRQGRGQEVTVRPSTMSAPASAGVRRPPGSAMLLLVGLGNPGARYAGNRHNIGFMAIDAIARAHRASPFRSRFLRARGRRDDRGRKDRPAEAHYLHERERPGGRCCGALLQDRPDDIAVLHDELDLAPGKLRVKTGGGNAGHNGLRSITAHLGNDYRRIRLGIGHPGDKAQVHNFVLNDFGKGERAWVEALCDAVADNVGLLAQRQDASFQNKVHLRMEAAGFAEVSLPGR